MPMSSLRGCSKPGCNALVRSGNRCDAHKYDAFYFPVLRKPLLPTVVMVCGSPASGKSTFVEQNKSDGDLVLDLDVILSGITGKPLHSDKTQDDLEWAFVQRNKLIERCQFEYAGQTLWFVIGAPVAADRQKWRDILNPEKVYVLICGEDVAVARIRERQSATERNQILAVYRWHENYSPLDDEIVLRTDEP